MPKSKSLPATQLPAPITTVVQSSSNPMPQIGVTPVFIHSSWRTSSTWFLLQFRRLKSTLCFYEPFNEDLASLTGQNLAERSHDSWSSGHPPSAPYYREFRPLLRSKGGVRRFVPRLSYAWFIPEGGLGGRLRPQELQYLNLLLRHAARRRKVPVLGFTRSLGRVGAMKREFPGQHIFVYRNLWGQWASYLSQKRHGNNYFLITLLRILLEADDHFFRAVINRHVVRAIEQGRTRQGSREQIAAVLADFLSEAELFGLFMAMHVYLYAFAETSADLAIDVTRLAREAGYRTETTQQLSGRIGLQMGFNDVEDAMQAHCATPGGIDWQEIREYCEIGLRALAHLSKIESLLQVGTRLIEETMAEMRTGERYVRGARNDLTRLQRHCDDLAAEQQVLHAAQANLAAERDEERSRRLAVEAERDQSVGERDAVAARGDALAAELEEVSRQRDAALADNQRFISEFKAAAAKCDEVASKLDELSRRHDAILANQEHRIGELQDNEAKRDMLAAELDQMTQQRDTVLAEKERLAGEFAVREADLDNQIERLTADLKQRDGDYRRIQERLIQMEASRRRVLENLRQRESEKQQLEDSLAQRDHEKQQVEGDLAQRVADCQRLETELAQHGEENRRLTEDLARRVDEMSLLAGERDQAIARGLRWFEAAICEPRDGSRAKRQYRIQSALDRSRVWGWLAADFRRQRRELTAAADRERDRQNWELAARRYRDALDLAPDRPAVWVQYGHALKESGNLAAAERAYRKSLAFDDTVADTHLQLGHVLKLQGREAEAAEAYLRSLALAPQSADAAHELLVLRVPISTGESDEPISGSISRQNHDR